MTKRELKQKLSKEILFRLYHIERRSLGDIAKLYGVSRVAIMNYCNIFNIPLRTKSQARIEAQKQGKLPQQFFAINENFFNNWSCQMAYVLGLIITDGCISKTGTVALSMNDKDLLEKVKKAMGSQHKITLSRHQKSLYCFHFTREGLAKKLNELGVIPRKSLTVKLPEVPQKYLPDFIRGVFDGDGSIYYDTRSPEFPIRTKFVSSSPSFIYALEQKLQELGLPPRKIYEQKTKNTISYMFKYGHKDSLRLFQVIYDDMSNTTIYMPRKYNKFIEKMSKGEDDGKYIKTDTF